MCVHLLLFNFFNNCILFNSLSVLKRKRAVFIGAAVLLYLLYSLWDSTYYSRMLNEKKEEFDSFVDRVSWSTGPGAQFEIINNFRQVFKAEMGTEFSKRTQNVIHCPPRDENEVCKLWPDYGETRIRNYKDGDITCGYLADASNSQVS